MLSVLAFDSQPKVEYTWYQRIACNIIRYGCRNLPRHIAIVMDGNRRFAQEHNLSRVRGHILGAFKLYDVCQWCYDFGIYQLSFYAFSLENFKRSQDEIDTLIDILRLKLNEFEKYLEEICKREISIRIIGHLDLLPDDIKQLTYNIMNKTNNYKKFILNIYYNYTSRSEITNTIKDFAKGCENDLIEINDIDDDLIIKSLILSTNQTDNLPDIFLRTSGELRLSDFMLLQCRFSMWIFVNIRWPEFNFWNLFSIILQYEFKSETMINTKNQCEFILKKDKNNNEEKNQRIKTYLNWIEQQRIQRLK